MAENLTDTLNAIAAVAAADATAEGDSPPPSRPLPLQPFGSKRKRQFKSTENVTKLLNTDSVEQLNQDLEQELGASIAATISPPPAPGQKRPSRRKQQETLRKGWGEQESNTGSLGWKTRRSESAPQEAQDIDDINDAGRIHVVNDEGGDYKGNSFGSGLTTTGRLGETENGFYFPFVLIGTDVKTVIPDLNDVEDEDISTMVAAPPSVKVNRMKTIRELDDDITSSTGFLNEVRNNDMELDFEIRLSPKAKKLNKEFFVVQNRNPQNITLTGIDVSILKSIALCAPEQIAEADVCWEWDVLFTEVSGEITAESEPVSNSSADINSSKEKVVGTRENVEVQ